MAKAFFTADYFDFFKELAANNHRDWFHENKKRYETSVKKPFHDFVEEVISKVQKEDKSVEVVPKQAIFRINRDIRFSKDKTPYKTNNSAIIAKNGRKGMNNPGMYIELGPEHIRVYGGQYMPDKELLYKIRTKIAKDPKSFEKAINDKSFKKVYGEIQGEKNKIIPKEFKEVGEKQPLIYNKGFYYYSEIPLDKITSPKLVELVMEKYKAAKPVRDWLHKL